MQKAQKATLPWLVTYLVEELSNSLVRLGIFNGLELWEPSFQSLRHILVRKSIVS